MMEITVLGYSNPRVRTVLAYINPLTIGLSLSIVGVIFLANSMTVRRPRRFISEYFGVERPQNLRSVYEQLRVKAQIFCGFLGLLVGFSMQIVAVVYDLWGPFGPTVAADVFVAKAQALALLAGAIVLVTVLLRMLQNLWSMGVFRRLMAEFFEEHSEWDFEKHPDVIQELGVLLGVPPQEDDSIGQYATRVRKALHMGPVRRRRLVHDDAFAPVRNVGSEWRR